MKLFLKRFIYFSALPAFVFVLLEFYVRDNSFKTKAEYISEHKDEIELLILGPSHSNRAINPAFLDWTTAPLTHGGSPINISILLFDKFVPQFPKLKYVIFDISYPVLEYQQGHQWEKNHLFFNYYGINNYGKTPHFREYFLLTANAKAYLWKLLTRNSTSKMSYNKFGFITETKTKYKTNNYDLERIKKKSKHLKKKHQHEDIPAFENNVQLLDQAISKCLNRNVKVILLAPPAFFLYNENRNENILLRRNKYLEKYQNVENVFVWNYEKNYENQIEYFANENHMNPKGAEMFTKEINKRIAEIETQ